MNERDKLRLHPAALREEVPVEPEKKKRKYTKKKKEEVVEQIEIEEGTIEEVVVDE